MQFGRRDMVQSIKARGRVGLPMGDYFDRLEGVASQLLLERAIGDRRLGHELRMRDFVRGIERTVTIGSRRRATPLTCERGSSCF